MTSKERNELHNILQKIKEIQKGNIKQDIIDAVIDKINEKVDDKKIAAPPSSDIDQPIQTSI